MRTGQSIIFGISTANRIIQRITSGLPVAAPVLIQTLFTCRYLRMASIPFSRPRPIVLEAAEGCHVAYRTIAL